MHLGSHSRDGALGLDTPKPDSPGPPTRKIRDGTAVMVGAGGRRQAPLGERGRGTPKSHASAALAW